ncbi:MAG: alpha-galactosidase, partial [Algoriphagus sp.]|nr:alpha-galactosidase [Algoriphagus sp.]
MNYFSATSKGLSARIKLLVSCLFLLGNLHVVIPSLGQSMTGDWLVDGKSRSAEIVQLNPTEIQLRNGLIQRTFFLSPSPVCYDFTNLMTGAQLLRTVMPEARVTLNGKTYEIGAKLDFKEKGYFKKEWLGLLKPEEGSFAYQGYTLSKITPHFPTKNQFWTGQKEQASGQKITFSYTHPEFPGLQLQVHYEIYDNLPLIGKYLTLENQGNSSIHIDQVVNEILGTVEEESAVVGATKDMKKPHQLYVENNFAFNNAMHAELSAQATHWKQDSSYTSQVNYDYQTPSTLEVYPQKGIGIDLEKGGKFQSIRTYELILDSYDRERNGLARRKMYRAIAPWTQQNPIFMHLVSKNDEQVRTAIDQCVDTGYEALILSFGSHINMEDNSPENIARWKSLADYAHSRGIKIGGYSLFSSRTIGPETDVISPITGK